MQRAPGVKTPSYSPDLAPNDFFFYPRLKKNLKGIVFPNLDTLEAAVRAEIGAIPSDAYRECILQKWPMRWACCVYKDGAYFEGLHYSTVLRVQWFVIKYCMSLFMSVTQTTRPDRSNEFSLGRCAS